MFTSLTSCQFDDPKPKSSKTDLLTAKAWKETDVKVAGLSVFATSIDDCEKDDLAKFNANQSVIFNEGTLKCAPAAPQTSMGSWEFTANETKLKITDSTGKVVEGTIGTLTDSTLILTAPNAAGTGTATEITYTAQ